MHAQLPMLVAGMPAITFTEVARLRLEVISFFLLGLLFSAGVVMLVWNGLRRDFVSLPELTFGKACGLVVLWGFFFVVVLTMISGARELMTPGAWEKTGATYKLREKPAPVSEPLARPTPARQEKLRALFRELLRAAVQNSGSFPADAASAALPAGDWKLPDLAGGEYVYVPGGTLAGPARPLAYEPEVYDGELLVLMTDGEIKSLALDEIRRLVEAAP